MSKKKKGEKRRVWKEENNGNITSVHKKFTCVGGTQPSDLSMIKGKNEVYGRERGPKNHLIVSRHCFALWGG